MLHKLKTNWKQVIEILTIVVAGVLVVVGAHLLYSKVTLFVAAVVLVLVEKLTIGEIK